MTESIETERTILLEKVPSNLLEGTLSLEKNFLEYIKTSMQEKGSETTAFALTLVGLYSKDFEKLVSKH